MSLLVCPHYEAPIHPSIAITSKHHQHNLIRTWQLLYSLLYLFIYLPIYLPTYQSIYLPTYLPIYLSIYLNLSESI